ncbi:MAG: hypothetical protein ACI9R3_000948 [Verrucomicrobiales bacterium]|jgi:hypothetical protein
MTKELSKEDQRFLDQSVQEVSTGMLATKVLLAAQDLAGEGGDVNRAYIKLRFRQLRQESAKQMRKVQRLRDQAGKLSDLEENKRRERMRSSSSSSSAERQVFDEDGVRQDHRRNVRSKAPAILLTIVAIGFFIAVGLAVFSAM